MNREPRTKTELCAITDGYTAHYSGAVPWGGRDVIKGSVVFRIGTPESSYFEGCVDEAREIIRWRRLSGAPLDPNDITGKFSPHSGYFQIIFNNKGLIQDGEQITVTYDWQPHHLTGAEVLVKVNNEERFVSIEELQSALRSYLGE
jgi:hypothetical protein